MTLEPLGGGGFDYVQDTQPSAPNIGETWYDEGETDVTNRSKIYADVGNGAEWVIVPSLEQSDILSDGTPFRGDAIPDSGTIPNTSQVGQGIDWSSKTPKADNTSAGRTLTVNGSGYLISIVDSTDGGSDIAVSVNIDGSNITNEISLGSGGSNAGPTFLFRFYSTLEVSELDNNSGVIVIYVLD